MIVLSTMKSKKINISETSLKKAPKKQKVNKKQKNKIETALSTLKSKWSKLDKKVQVTILSIIAIIILTSTSYYFYSTIVNKPVPPELIVKINNNYLEPNTNKELIKESLKQNPRLTYEPVEPRTEENPLSGIMHTKSEMEKLLERRPVAVMVNNHQLARPQSSLSKADIVIEAIAESGITRHLAIFWEHGVEKVGPIRSARQYHLEWLSPFDALYIHDGYAFSSDPRIDAGGNIHRYGIKDINTIGAWREFDGVRYAPHNEYSSVVTAWDYAKEQGWDGFPDKDKKWKFKFDAPKQDRGDKTHVLVKFEKGYWNGGLYDVEWIYDKNSNSYLRKIGGANDIDQENNQQIKSKNVIIQRISMVPSYDQYAHQIITTIDEGDAVILIDGKIVNAKWKKKSRTDRTLFYDMDGNEIEFNRGQTWICAVPINQGEFDIIDQ